MDKLANSDGMVPLNLLPERFSPVTSQLETVTPYQVERFLVLSQLVLLRQLGPSVALYRATSAALPGAPPSVTTGGPIGITSVRTASEQLLLVLLSPTTASTHAP